MFSKVQESRRRRAKPKTQLILPQEEVVRHRDGSVGIASQQLIPSAFLSNLADLRQESRRKREGEFMLFAQIPTIFIDKWIREGFNLLADKNITYQDVLARLHKENLTGFLATTKRV